KRRLGTLPSPGKSELLFSWPWTRRHHHQTTMHLRNIALASTVVGLLTQTGFAEVAYYHLSIPSLTFTEGTLPARPDPSQFRRWQTIPAYQPYAVLDCPGEVYIGGEGLRPWDTRSPFEDAVLAIRAEKGIEVAGRLFVPK